MVRGYQPWSCLPHAPRLMVKCRGPQRRAGCCPQSFPVTPGFCPGARWWSTPLAVPSSAHLRGLCALPCRRASTTCGPGRGVRCAPTRTTSCSPSAPTRPISGGRGLQVARGQEGVGAGGPVTSRSPGLQRCVAGTQSPPPPTHTGCRGMMPPPAPRTPPTRHPQPTSRAGCGALNWTGALRAAGQGAGQGAACWSPGTWHRAALTALEPHTAPQPQPTWLCCSCCVDPACPNLPPGHLPTQELRLQVRLR